MEDHLSPTSLLKLRGSGFWDQRGEDCVYDTRTVSSDKTPFTQSRIVAKKTRVAAGGQWLETFHDITDQRKVTTVLKATVRMSLL